MSKKAQIYRQCRFEKDIENGKLSTVAWIPAYGAKKGNVVDLEYDNGDYSYGWTVVSVGGTKNVEDLELQRKALRRWGNVLDEKNHRTE